MHLHRRPQKGFFAFVFCRHPRALVGWWFCRDTVRPSCCSCCCVLAFSSFPPRSVLDCLRRRVFGVLCLFCFSCLGSCLSGRCCSVSSHYMRPVFVLFAVFLFVPGLCCFCLLSFSAVFCPALRVLWRLLVFIPPPRFSCIIEHFKRLLFLGCILSKIKEQPPPVFWVLVALLVLLVAALLWRGLMPSKSFIYLYLF